MKNLKKIMAIILVAMMTLSLLSVFSFASDYQITVTNTSKGANINGCDFKAYKLFDASYVEKVYGEDGTTVIDQTTTSGNDTTPHSYYLSKSSPFYDGIAGVKDPDNTGDTGAAADGSTITILKKYFTFTTLSGDDSKVLVEPIMDSNGKSTFDEAKAYALAEELSPILSTISDTNYVTTKTADSNTSVVIDTGAPGYYLVTGSAHPYKEELTQDSDGNYTGTVDTSKTVTAAVALTTTDPKAEIKAKLDATVAEKEIDEGTTPGALDNDDVKEDNHAVGDKVPYIIKAALPNMTGYEKYFFVVNDTMSKGLTFNNDVAIKFVDPNGTDDYTLVSGTDYTVTYTGGNGEPTAIKIVFNNFIQWKGNLVVDDGDDVETPSANDYRTLGLTKAAVGTYYGEYTGDDIVITYSGTINSNAVIGNEGNENTVKIVYSNNPDIVPDSKTDEPSEKDKDITGETPESKTKTYVTGLKILKYTGASSNKNPLAGAKFTLEGTNLNQLVETTKDYFRRATSDDTATHYLLKDGTYTTVAPTTDTTETDEAGATVTVKGTIDLYVKTWEGDTAAPGYVKDTVKEWTREGSAEQKNVKYTVTTDAEGLMTFTGLAAGDYTLTEIEAPTGYNVLKDPIYITISVGDTEEGNLNTHTWTVTYKIGENGTSNTLTADALDANLFELDVLNQTGTEMPSTGGIGTTIFYVVGSVLVIGTGIVLVTRKRMGKEN